MAVLVTGGAGYVGSHFVLDLIDAGERVVVLDDCSNSDPDTVPANATFVKGDIGDRALVLDTLSVHECTEIVHFAASTIVPESVANPIRYYRNNSANSLSLIETAIDAGVERFVFSSTAAVYGVVDHKPVAERTDPRPTSPYGRSKLATEQVLRDVDNTGVMRYAALRYFNVAGADPNGRTGQSTANATHLIKVACQVALGLRSHLEIFGDKHSTPDGTGVRDYIHVSDLSKAHLLALRHLRYGGDSFVANCGYGRGFSVWEVIRCVEEIANTYIDVRIVPPRPGDLASVVADPSRIVNKLGWQPEYDDLRAVVKSAYQWEQKISMGSKESSNSNRPARLTPAYG